jgi:hypothetical protein
MLLAPTTQTFRKKKKKKKKKKSGYGGCAELKSADLPGDLRVSYLLGFYEQMTLQASSFKFMWVCETKFVHASLRRVRFFLSVSELVGAGVVPQQPKCLKQDATQNSRSFLKRLGRRRKPLT